MAIILKNDEVIIEQNGVILFRGTQKELEQFVIDSFHIASHISCDIQAGLIEDDEFSNLDFDSYKEFSDKYGINPNDYKSE